MDGTLVVGSGISDGAVCNTPGDAFSSGGSGKSEDRGGDDDDEVGSAAEDGSAEEDGGAEEDDGIKAEGGGIADGIADVVEGKPVSKDHSSTAVASIR